MHHTPDQTLKEALGISDKSAALFARAGVETLAQLWFYLPSRYENRAQLTPIDCFRDGAVVQFIAEVVDVQVIFRRHKLLVVTLRDEQGSVCSLRFFRFYPSQQQQFTHGRRGLFYGKAVYSSYGYELHHPDIEWLSAGEQPKLDEGLTAIYPTVKGITQKRWRAIIAKALLIADEILPVADPLTAEGLPSLSQALRTIHQPSADISDKALRTRQHPAFLRLKYEELCAHQLSIQQARLYLRSTPAPAMPHNMELLDALKAQLPFQLTSAQERVSAEIAADLGTSKPMLRLVQGDVGSGKTLVALLACLQCVAAGYQAALMAPTELLAGQHALNLRQLLGDLPVTVTLLVSKLPAKDKRAMLHDIECGNSHIIVGTHALFQQQVKYHRLGLVVIDEQHRFGVHQRLALQQKGHDGQSVHQLIMTATPIPRTLAMSQYGELDLSVIDALPAGRKEITTAVVSNLRRDEVVQRVAAVCRQGQQAYWVCPLIEESEAIECENAEATANQLQDALPDLRIGLLHGRMATEERQTVMAKFVAGEIALLVATTVIEVGVDVANASLMIIENAERFGLAQLHQLRGRVGRGSAQSYCLLMYQKPLGKVAKQRLTIMRESSDGFVIAEEDMRIRGAGELLGKRQAGDAMLRVADFEQDADLLPKVNQLCHDWLLNAPEFVAQLSSRWLADKAQFLQA